MTRGIGVPIAALLMVGTLLSPPGAARLEPHDTTSSASANRWGFTDSNSPVFTMALSFYNASQNSTQSVLEALTGWLFFNASGMQEIENYTVTNGGEYTFSNFSALQLTAITDVAIVGANPTGFPAATTPIVEYGNLSNESSLTVALNFTDPAPSYSSPPPTQGAGFTPVPLESLFVELVGIGLFVAVLWIGVIGWKKVLRPMLAP